MDFKRNVHLIYVIFKRNYMRQQSNFNVFDVAEQSVPKKPSKSPNDGIFIVSIMIIIADFLSIHHDQEILVTYMMCALSIRLNIISCESGVLPLYCSFGFVCVWVF